MQGVPAGSNGHHGAMAVTEADVHAAALALPTTTETRRTGPPASG